MSDKVFVGERLADLDFSDPPQPITRVTLNVDNETYFTAGDDTGMTLEKDIPWGTQAMANAILAALKDYKYVPFTGKDAILNPAAEIGDGITVGGVYSVLVQRDINFGALSSTGVAAPISDEIDDEYPYLTRSQRQTRRKEATTYASIKKTSSGIELRVEALEDSVDGLETSYSSIEQYVHSITLTVKNSSTSSTITLTAGGVEISSEEIVMDGLVTFTGLASGETIIDGGCIQTGTIDAEYLNLTGAIKYGDLDENTQRILDESFEMAQGAEDAIDEWAFVYEGTTYIDGTKIMTGTVTASILQGGYVDLLDKDENVVGYISIGVTSTGLGLQIVTDEGGILLHSAGNFWVQSQAVDFGTVSAGEFQVGGHVVPISVLCEYNLGDGENMWGDVFCANVATADADYRAFEDVSYDLSSYDVLFDVLKPAKYKLVTGTSGRTHLNFVGQDIEKSLSELSIATTDFAAFIKSPKKDESGEIIPGEYVYGIRDGELIPLCVRQIQLLKARVAALEGKQQGGTVTA